MTMKTFSSIFPFTRRFGVRGVTCMTNGAEGGGGVAEQKDKKMAGIVYVLTNEAMPDLVKIGHTNSTDVKDLRQRVRNLYTTGVPLPFDIYHAVRAEDPKKAEDLLHEAFRDYRINPNREFFSVLPERVIDAMGLLEICGSGPVDLNGGDDDGDDESIPEENRVTKEVRRAVDRQARRNRPPFRFSGWGIPIGSVLRFVRDHAKTAKVVSDTDVELDGERMRLSPAAGKLLPFGVRVAGAGYWEYEDPEHGWELLNERRNRMSGENNKGDEE